MPVGYTQLTGQPSYGEGFRAGRQPGDNESAGVNYSHRSPKGNRHMRRLLNQAANAAARTKGSIFEIVYLPLRFPAPWTLIKPSGPLPIDSAA